MLKAGTSVPPPELISSPCIASFVDGEAIQVSPSPACGKWWKNGEKSGNGKPFVQGWTHTHTLIELHTDLKAVATRQPKKPNPEKSRKTYGA